MMCENVLETASMTLATTYMGFELPHPLIPGSSPLADHLDMVRRLEDAGAPMIVLRSLFEEQMADEDINVALVDEPAAETYTGVLQYLPESREFKLKPDEYLEQIRKIKAAVAVPVIGSLNGTTEWGWLRYAKLIEEAGADGLELNLYELAIDLDVSGQEIERQQLQVLRSIKAAVKIPVAVKLSPFYSSIAHFAAQLDQAGADALILFNRFYQPDVDVEQSKLLHVNLSSAAELPLRLRWIGVLSGRLKASLAATGGVHTAVDVVKAMLVGGHATQLVSAILQHGPEYLSLLRRDIERWLEEHHFDSLRQVQGRIAMQQTEDPAAYQRANYIRLLQSWERPS
jgi:dihydroorotate dehydrogenase (fumarate)